MNQRKFPHNDPLFNEVVDAADALHKLNVSIHYPSCGKTGSGSYPAAFGSFADRTPLASPQPHDQPESDSNQRRSD
jgi:hypothetical protein